MTSSCHDNECQCAHKMWCIHYNMYSAVTSICIYAYRKIGLLFRLGKLATLANIVTNAYMHIEKIGLLTRWACYTCQWWHNCTLFCRFKFAPDLTSSTTAVLLHLAAHISAVFPNYMYNVHNAMCYCRMCGTPQVLSVWIEVGLFWLYMHVPMREVILTSLIPLQPCISCY